MEVKKVKGIKPEDVGLEIIDKLIDRNYNKGRFGYDIDGITLHTVGGQSDGTDVLVSSTHCWSLIGSLRVGRAVSG